MIAHLVLFRPKQGLTGAERDALIGALERALLNIPVIRRARVGRRIVLGRAYEAQNSLQFPVAAVLEFESEADLRAYLDDPAHVALGEQFYLTAEDALVFDFEWFDAARARESLLA